MGFVVWVRGFIVEFVGFVAWVRRLGLLVCGFPG